jgi:formate hydrogenlyase transcriptional activator
MKTPAPVDEQERLDALRRYKILDTLPEPEFDDLALLAARICGTPTALVTLVDADRQWFKAKVGFEATETSRDLAFCSHAILNSDLLVVPDASTDNRFSTNPLVTGPSHIRFYAGAPLIAPGGHALGTLCVIDRVPRQLAPEQAKALHALSRQVVAQLELRRARADLQSALIASEEFRTRLIEGSKDCIKVLDLEGRLLSMNEGGMRALEICELAPLVNSSWIDFWQGGDRTAAHAAVEKARSGGTGRFVGYFATAVTKQPRWWDVVVSPIHDAEGKPERLLAISRDVTEHKLNEEALREAHLQVTRSEERWRAVFENSAIGVALTDLEGRFLAANPVYQKMLGFTDEELRARSFLDVTHEDYREANGALVAELLEGKREEFQIEKQYRRKDGSLIWVKNSASFVTGTESMPRFLMTVSEDITERKKSEQALHQSEEQVRLILDSAAEAIFGCDPGGACLFCNPAAVRLLGYDDPSELLGKNMHALEHHTRADGRPYPIEECPIYIGFQNGEGVHRDDEVYWRKDGTCFPVEFWSHPIFREGRTLGAVITFVDITERKQAEESLRKSEQRQRILLEINNAIITNLTQEALYHAICDALRTVFPVDGALLTLYEPERDTLRIIALEKDWNLDFFRVGTEINRTDSHHGWVFDHQRPLFRGDLATEWQYPIEQRVLDTGLRSICIAPLMLEGKSIGTLGIGSHRANQYSAADAEFLCEVAGQVALAAANMKAYEQIGVLNVKVQRTAERLRTLLEINNAIITNLTEESLLRSISDAMRPLVPFDRCAITLYKPETDTLRFLAVEGALRSAYFKPGLEVGRSDTSAGWVFDRQQPLLRRNLEEEQEFDNERQLCVEGLRSLCVVPLVLRGKSIGTLSVVSRKEQQYSEGDAQFLQEVAAQLALAIANMKAYEEIGALKARLEKENVYLQEEIRAEHNFEEIVGNSPALLAALRKVEQVAATDSTVLISGETGTGKELIARAIHNRSARKDRALVRVNCSAISAGLVESELFGHLKGAFTGAVERRVGRFELADGGTIFLDEIGELPLDTQVKLLRVLQEREFEPVGSSRPLQVDVRVIAATNRNLEESIKAGHFRSDLFYRLNVFPLELPPLRERRSDIPQLVAFYMSRFSKRFGKKVEGVSQESMDRLMSYPWPGNVRELQNVVERAIVLSAGATLHLDKDLLPVTASRKVEAPEIVAHQAGPGALASSSLPTLEEMERNHILAALQRAGGVVEGPKGAARLLNLHPNTLRHRMSKFGIKRSDHRPL